MTDGPCLVHQYADDTIILVRAETEGVARLKQLLDMFSSATGLKINYDKSTITPMHLLEGALEEFLGVLNCNVGSFP